MPNIAKQIALVVNTKSRSGRSSFKRATKLLQAKGFEVVACPISNPNKLRPTVRNVMKQGVKTLVIGGGDGSISEIVGDVAYSDVVLGILPLGTANSFTRSLDIPQNLEDAIEIIANGKVATVNLGKINERFFANAVSIGIASAIAQDIPDTLKKRFGIFAYALQCIRNIPKITSYSAVFEGKKTTTALETYQIVIANGGYYGPALLVKKKELQSSNLTIFTFKNQSPLRILLTWMRAVFGRRFSDQEIQTIHVTEELLLSTTPSQPVSIDGEIKTHTPIRVGVAAKALHVLVGENSHLKR